MIVFNRFVAIVFFSLLPWSVSAQEAEENLFIAHRFGVGLNLGSNVFGLSGTVYSITYLEWLMLETHLSYHRESGEIKETKYNESQIFAYSAAVLQLRLDPVVPYLGVGPGVESFDQQFDGQTVSEGTVGGLVSFAGTKLFLSKHFGLDARVLMFAYFGDGPKDLEKQDEEAPTTVSRLEIGAFLYL